MQLAIRDPFRDFQRMEKDFDKFWEDDKGILPYFASASTIDMYKEGGNLGIDVSLPNFKKEEVNISVEGNILEVTAEHKEEETKESKRRYYFRESRNHFMRRLTLPDGVVADKAIASLKDGVLKVTMPITESKKKTKSVKIS